jgi:iron complex outermembrane recepter protein
MDDRRALFASWSCCAAGTVVLVVATASGSLLAEEEAADPAPLQTVVVTGSRIPRPDFESASPIVTIGAEVFERTGAPTVEEALNRLPQIVPSAGSTSNNPSADGQAFLNLRGFGPKATLVLLDGRRLTPANGNGVVDVTLLPPSLIERVEIVSGGASAVYGSDAVAGVVNFILRDSFEGIEAGGFYSDTDRGGGEQWDAHLIGGTVFADGRGSAYGFVGRSERRLLTQGERQFSRYELVHVGPGVGFLGPDNAFVPGGSVLIEEGGVFLPIGGPNAISADTFEAVLEGYGYPPGSVPLQPTFGFNQDSTLFTLGNFTPGSVANFRGDWDPAIANDFAYRYNYAPVNALQLPLERTSFFGRLNFELTPMAELYADAMYADYETMRQLAPTPVSSVFMSSDNPFIPADLALLLDSRPNPGAPVFWFKRMSELGPRIAINQNRMRQGTVGIEAYVFGDWLLDAYVQYGDVRQQFEQQANALRSRMESLTFAPDGGVATCGGFDIFGLGSISPGCASYVSVDGANEARVRQAVAEAAIVGPVMELPAGELRAAFGVFHKRDEYSYSADPIVAVILPDGRSDIVGFNASDDIDGQERNTDVYVEALVPLLDEFSGFGTLEAGLGYRRSEYRAAGGVNAYKAELLYRPADALRVRGSYQNAMRAPSVNELFAPQLPWFDGLIGIGGDPCEAGSAARTGPDAAAVEALCVAQGMSPELLEGYQSPFPFARGFIGGNPELTPERAKTWTLGLAWSPTRRHPSFGTLQASVDWYRIRLDDAIATIPISQIVAFCFDSQVNPGYDPDQPWCTSFSRDPATGEIIDALGIQRNVALVEVSGIDLQLDWRRPTGPGELGANLLVSWLDSFKRGAGAGAPVEQRAGIISWFPGSALPEWKALLNLDYSWRGSSVNLRTQYITSARNDDVEGFRIPSRTYLDLFFRHDFGPGLLDGLRLGLGIENLADRDPPLVPWGPANTDPQQYDILGRRYFARLSYRF